VVSSAAHHGGDLPGALTVTLALAWFTAATVMHSVLAGLSALPGGQYEAALTQGFSTQQTLWRVLLPQALRNILPSLVGIFISLLKDTSLAFIVNVPELTTVAGQVNNRVQIYPAAIFIFTGWSTTCSAARSNSLQNAGALPGQRFNHRFHRFGCQFAAFDALVRQRGTQHTGNDNMLWLLP
jgi:ABC-type amino acid transport system permease subunit